MVKTMVLFYFVKKYGGPTLAVEQLLHVCYTQKYEFKQNKSGLMTYSFLSVLSHITGIAHSFP